MRKDLATAAGSVHSLETLNTLPDDDCNILAVSSRTLYIMQNYSLQDVGFLARYAVSYGEGGVYFSPDPGSPEAGEVADLSNNFGLELFEMGCDIVGAINELTNAVVAARTDCSCDVGQGSDNASGTLGGAVPDPIGDITYAEPSATPNRQCKVANDIYFKLLGMFQQLDSFNVDDMGLLGLVLVVGLIGTILGSLALTPIGGVIVGVAGIVAVFAAKLLGLTISLEDIVTVLISEEDDLICALKEALTADGARSAFETVLVDEGSLSSAEREVAGFMLTNAVLNVLFFDVDDSAAFYATYVPPNDCSTCSATFSHTFDFLLSDGGWTNSVAQSRPFGVYTVGVGWQSVWGAVAADFDERLYLSRVVAATTFTSMSVTYTVAGVTGIVSNDVVLITPLQEEQQPQPCQDCSFVHTFVPGTPQNTTLLRSVAVGDAVAEFDVDMTITKIVVTGEGADPF